MTSILIPGIAHEEGRLSPVSPEEFDTFLERYGRGKFYGALTDVASIRDNREATFYRWDTETEPQRGFDPKTGEDFYDIPVRAFLAHLPLQFEGFGSSKISEEGSNKIQVPYDGYFTVWLSRGFGLGIYTHQDFELNFAELDELDRLSWYGLGVPAQMRFDLQRSTGLKEDEVEEMLGKRGSEEWIDFRMKYHLDGDAYVHLVPNRDRLEMKEGMVNLTDDFLHGLVKKMRELRNKGN